MKTDEKLRNDIIEELAWEPSIREAEIGVAVKEGVVTLSGYVQSYAQKCAAEAATERIGGVRAIADDLHVKLPGDHQRTDTEVAHAVANALDWDIEVPFGITTRVENGWVYLDGELDWPYQKGAAERAVRYLTGVKGVTNRIRVKPRQVSPADVSRRISQALHRAAELDANRIEVEARNGSVTLTGTVRSLTERAEVERAAWSAPGVTAVDDHLRIALV